MSEKMSEQKFRIIVVVVALAVAAGAAIWRPWADDLPDDAAFAIGERVVTVDELDARNDSLRALYGIEEPTDDKERSTFRRQSAKSMAISLVLEAEVEKEGVDVSEAKVDEAMAAFVEQQFGGDHAAFVQALGNVHTSEKAVRAEIRRQFELRLLLERIAGDVAVSDDELKAEFEKRRESLNTPARREVRNIVVSSRKEARRVRDQLDRGADAARLAREVSIDGATRDTGGDLGTVAQGDLLPEVGEAVFAVPPGSPYGPVQGTQGWNVGVVGKALPAEEATFAKVRKELRQTVQAERVQAKWTGWLAERMEKADIRYQEEYRPTDPNDISSWEQQGIDGTGTTGGRQ